MLGDIARWLRILGEDCVYASPDWDDDEVLARAVDDDRVLVTRDTELVGRAAKVPLRAVLVPQEEPEVVLLRVYRALGRMPSERRMATRCAMCNGALVQTDGAAAVEQAAANGREAPRDEVLKRHDDFWSCSVCGQAYWRGTHWEGIEHMRRRLVAGLDGDPTA